MGTPPFSDRLEDARVGTLLNFPYSNRPHRYRLLPQAYGIGALKTEDHMKFSVMVPAPPPSDWYLEKLWIGDSFFYSPMIYDYFSAFTADPGNDALSLFYDDVYVKATRMEPETIIDKDGQGNWVEKEIYTPPPIFIDVNQAGPDNGIQLSLFDSNWGDAGRPINVMSPHFADVVRVKNIPGLRTATHYAYNWGNPWYCWDRLKEFGIPEDILGPRPAFDYNKTIPDSRW